MRTSEHELPKLPYNYDALEPYISKQTMELHHMKLHQMYIDRLNAAEAAFEKANSIAERTRIAHVIGFNGGGHVNHSLFWANLAPPSDKNKGNGGVLKDGPLKDAINRAFGDCETMKREFNKMACAIDGVGWGWVAYNPLTDQLELGTTTGQDPVNKDRAREFHVPIIGVDIWEHAYFLQYFNEREKYVDNIWKCINFEEAERRLREARENRKKPRNQSKMF